MSANTCTIYDVSGRAKENPQYGTDVTWIEDEFDPVLVASPYYRDGRNVPNKHTYTVSTTKPT